MKDGERRIDTSAVYSIILAEEEVAALESILRRFKVRAEQEAVYLEIERNVDVRFL